MKKPLLQSVFVLLLALAAGSASAQITSKAYAPENLRTLSVQDQTRVISLEYSEQSRGRRIPDDQLRFYLDQVNRSNWTFSRIKQDIAQSLGGNSGGWNPNPPAPGQTILCESKSGDARRCTPPWRGPSRLVRQLSNSRCEEGTTWSSQDGLITVWKGCRGEFAAAGGSTGTIRCESTDGRGRTCRTPWSGHSRLTRQLSRAACVEGQSWQSQRGQVYVGNGCRAEFAPRIGGGGGGSSHYSVTCSSENNRRHSCAYDPRQGRPILLQQLSNTSCREGYSWGYAGNQIWVDRGCRGRFGPR
ncbi:DUF3011 domain-containing protein [Pseudoxanthomonas sp. F37]|uniref:DUF3011 domain-containing protein n=1 Tax=Pseudoxanthomonas TaxID=83618 RepID=UPI001FD0EFEE|nr:MULTISPECIES: DUF3011 domain-containing protein [Pseudoxanthomonas]UOV06459.1 DUF3011 domain-containing protein [Pseudoxanthomonas mexicana]UOV08064.1 DUF3011 domain-containing protein [Pseudoxanthomonas sp. F37]